MGLALATVCSSTVHARVRAPGPTPTTPPIIVVRFERVVPSGHAAGIVLTRVRVVAELPNGQVRQHDLATLTARCIEDVGGLETLAVMTCTAHDGRVREFVLEERRRDIVATEYSVHDRGTGRRLVRRVSVTRTRRGWTTVPRCAATLHDPLACMPQN